MSKIPRYEVQRVWKYGARRYVIPIPWQDVKYVLIRKDEEGILIFPVDIKNDSEAAQLAANLNKRLEANKE